MARTFTVEHLKIKTRFECEAIEEHLTNLGVSFGRKIGWGINSKSNRWQVRVTYTLHSTELNLYKLTNENIDYNRLNNLGIEFKFKFKSKYLQNNA